MAAKCGRRERFSGRFKRFGTKPSYNGGVERTVLLVEIKDSQGSFVTDHLWFNFTKGFQSLDLKEGDTVEFEARVSDYLKGYIHDECVDERTVDYRLSYPTKIKKLEANPASTQELPSESALLGKSLIA